MTVIIKKKGCIQRGISPKFVILVPALLAGISVEVNAREFFDPAFIRSVGQSDPKDIPDLSVYSTQDAQVPGEYRVDVILNSEHVETTTIRFVENAKNGTTTLVPCLSLKMLADYGVRISSFHDLKEDNNGCSNTNIIPDFKTEFNFNTQQLLISVPQAALASNVRDSIPESEFDDGINALMTNYQFTAGKEFKDDYESYNLNLQSGLNVGPWRIRNLSIWNKSSANEGSWDSVYLYAQRNITRLKSTLVVGESSSLSSIFDSVPFTGIQLATDNEMLPESQRGYAPVIRGIAKTNARIIVEQNGYQVYQAYVAPGAFEITDMYATGGNGDLYVTVEEADGTKQKFIVPFATLPLMLREGQLEYELTSGKYRPYDRATEETPFTQATISYGALTNTTFYSGLQAASKYQSLAMGIGHNLGNIGALSIDVIQAWSKMKDNEKTNGQSWRLRYGKNIIQTGTNITVAGYRYSTRGFNTLTEVLDSYINNSNHISARSVKNRTNLTINQSLGDGMGNISVTGLFEDYWDSNRRNRSLSVGYNGGWNRINYYLGYSYNRYTWDSKQSGKVKEDDHLFTMNISVPLSNWLPNTYATYQLTNNKPGSTDQYVSLGGVALENNNLDWNVQQGYSNRDSTSGGAYTSYRGSHGSVNGGYSYSKHSQQINYGASGGVLVHADGVTFGQEMADTAALVKAPGLSGVTLETDSTIKTDYRGYAIIPHVSPYRKNGIALDSTTLADNMELPVTTMKVVPTRGAITRANFEGNIGRRAFLILKQASGADVPYGATVTLATEQKSQASIVSDGGMVYMSGLKDTGEIFAQWGTAVGQQCKATYNLASNTDSIAQATAICR